MIKRTAKKILNKLGEASADHKELLLAMNHDIKVLREDVYKTKLTAEQTDRKVHSSGCVMLREDLALVKLYTGAKMYVDPRDAAVAPHLMMDGVWEQPITKAWLRCLENASTTFDIGANFGYYGILAAQQRRNNNAKVVFFEANPDLIPYIQKSLDVNWLNEYTSIENQAVADQSGQVTLNVLKDYLGSSSLLSSDELDKYLHTKMRSETQKLIEVSATSIDDYCVTNGIRSVDLIKLDIEGYEDKAYQGMKKIASKSKNLTVFLEFTKQAYDNPRKLFADLTRDFPALYTIDSDGSLRLIASPKYEDIIDQSEDWVMLVFSKIMTLK